MFPVCYLLISLSVVITVCLPSCDLLWADPEPAIDTWMPNIQRGISFAFGAAAAREFCRRNGFDVIIRAHQASHCYHHNLRPLSVPARLTGSLGRQVVEQGYEFTHDQRVVTVFTAPNYCGQFQNCGATLCVGQNLECHFVVSGSWARLSGWEINQSSRVVAFAAHRSDVGRASGLQPGRSARALEHRPRVTGWPASTVCEWSLRGKESQIKFCSSERAIRCWS